MPRYVAFLRAINVGGHVVKMDRLRALFGDLRLGNVETFIASGNVLFDSAGKSTAAMEARIEKHLEQALGYPVATFVRPMRELDAVLAAHRFNAPEFAGCGIWVGFLKVDPPDGTRDTLLALATDIDAFDLCGREVYWLCRTNFSDSKIGKSLDKALSMPVTFRNITTVRRLAARAP